MRNYLFVFILIIFMTGCSATKPAQHLLKINNIDKSRVALHFKEAVERSNPIQLKPGIFTKEQLSTDDNLMLFKSNDKSFRSNFKLFQFKGDSDKKYTLSIRSYCFNDCTGLDKYNMLPLIYIFNSKGENVIQPVKSYRSLKMMKGIVIKFFLFGSGEFILPENGDYYIMVSADNRYSGKPIGNIQIHGTSASYTLDMPYAIQGYPIGEFEIMIK